MVRLSFHLGEPFGARNEVVSGPIVAHRLPNAGEVVQGQVCLNSFTGRFSAATICAEPGWAVES